MPASERARTRRASAAWPAASRSSAVSSGGAPRSGPSLANSVGSGDSSGEALAPTSYSTTLAPRSKPSSVARWTTGSATGSSLTTATIVGWDRSVMWAWLARQPFVRIKCCGTAYSSSEQYAGRQARQSPGCFGLGEQSGGGGAVLLAMASHLTTHLSQCSPREHQLAP